MNIFKRQLILLKIILIFLILISSQSIYASDNTILKAGNWKISHSKALLLGDVITEGEWDLIDDISRIKNLKIKDDCRYIWLRGEIFISENPSHYHGISTGRMDHLYTLYLNNRKIVSFSKNNTDHMLTNRHYLLRENELKEGKNYVYIRLGIFRGYIGGVFDGISIMGKDDFQRNRFFYTLKNILIPFSICFLYVFINILFFFILLASKKRSLYVSIILINLFAIVFFVFLVMPYSVMSHNLIYSLSMAILPISVLLFLIIYQGVYHVYLSKQNIIIIPVFIVITLILALFSRIIASHPINTGFFLSLILISSVYQLYFIMYLNSIRKDAFKLYALIIHIGLNMAIYLLAGIIGPVGSRYSNLVITYAFPVGFVIIPYLLIRDYKNRRIEMETAL